MPPVWTGGARCSDILNSNQRTEPTMGYTTTLRVRLNNRDLLRGEAKWQEHGHLEDRAVQEAR